MQIRFIPWFIPCLIFITVSLRNLEGGDGGRWWKYSAGTITGVVNEIHF